MVYEEAEKLKKMLINCIRFAFAKKHVPAEITDHIDLEQEVGISESALKAYQSAKTRQEKGEVLSELYHEVLHDLLEKYPALRQYFKKEAEQYNIWSEIEDQRKFLDTLWDTYHAAENGEDWAIQLIHDEGYKSLEDFKEHIEEKERELEQMIREVEAREARRLERTKRRKKKVEVKAPKESQLEREVANLKHMLQSVIADKLRLFAKAELLEKGYSISEVRRAIQRVELEIANLASAIASEQMSEQEAERKLAELLNEAIRTVTLNKNEVLKKLEREYMSFLTKHGVTNLTRVLKEVKQDLETLAEEVAEGRMAEGEALERVTRLGIPSVARYGKTVGVSYEEERGPEGPELAPEGATIAPTPSRPSGFLYPRQAADLIWNKYRTQLLIFGLRYVFEMYGREEGMTDYILKKTANYLAVYVRNKGLELLEKGEREGKGRLVIVGTALEKYPFLVVWNGVLKAMARAISDFWSALQLHTHLINALTSMGIDGCVAKAFTGVAYEVLHVPMDMWPEDVRQCYETLVNIAGADP